MLQTLRQISNGFEAGAGPTPVGISSRPLTRTPCSYCAGRRAAVPKCSQSRRLGLDSRRTQGASVSGSQRIRAEHTSRTESNGRTRQPFPPIIKVSIFAKSLMLIDQLFNQARLISIVARVLLVRITHAQPPSQREAPVSFPSINLSLFIYIASNPDRTSTIQPPTPSLSHSG